MKDINLTKANIKKIEEFVKYLKYNTNEHSKNIKNPTNLEDLSNSVAFLEDYAEVSEKLVEVIKDYCQKTGMEF